MVDFTLLSSANPIGQGKILETEQAWVAQYDFLESQGYSLRPRYRPGWTASWNNRWEQLYAEDSFPIQQAHLLDAIRKSDRKAVMLKRVPRTSPEIAISQFLGSEELRDDPRNHSLPLLRVLYDDKDPESAILVLPVLRRMDSPRPVSIRECVALVEQTLEGLVFLHEHHIAHRDCSWGNIMMDARGMFPKGWHPQQWTREPNGKDLKGQNSTRTAAGGVRYYFIDFGISTRGNDSVLGLDGQEEAPELSDDVPYNPYKLDVYILGMMYKHFIIEEVSGADFILPLIQYMTPDAPEDRPSAQEAFERFKTIQGKMRGYQLSMRLRPLEPESVGIRLIKDAYYWLCDRWWTLKPKKKLEPLV
ncbi:hypothetical protein FRB97_004377 [Tulasnella sp. 331]|nr:hypothetical protein FRB98_002290 [Tulasnella sp. 332]KAG8884368.1 hypothetical protein FRB97_004377 [Tulasnella sp. 331]